MERRRARRRTVAAAALAAVGVLLACGQPAWAAFSPQVRLELDPPSSARAPGIVLSVHQAPDETPTRDLSVNFPRGFGLARPAAAAVCGADEAAARSCAQASQVGSFEALTHAGEAVSGPIHVTRVDGVTELVMLLSGAGGDRNVPASVRRRAGGGVELTLEEAGAGPALGTLRLRLAGGERGLVRNPLTCGRSLVETRLASAAGEQAAVRSPVEIEGCGVGAGEITSVRVAPRRVASGRSVRLTWRASRRTRFTRVYVMVRRKGRWQRIGSLRGGGRKGRNALRFSGRLGGRPLGSGRYRFALVPTGGNSAVTASFTVVAPRG